MSMPKISIIITAFLPESKGYLDLCVESIQNLNYPQDRLDIIIVSPPSYKPQHAHVRVVHPTKDPYNNAHALNWGALHADSQSQYLLFCNDDVIFTKSSLTNLVISSQSIGDRGIFMPIGNDQQNRYMWPVPYMSVGQYRLEHLKGHEETLMNAESQYPCGMIFCQTLCLYAVLVPRPVYEIVGQYDEGGWQDDVDYCRRVAKQGLVNAICMNSLVYHAGGPSADITQGALDSEARLKSLKRYNDKWEGQ